jgi:tetratricopeptide (TPR) repeat protein
MTQPQNEPIDGEVFLERKIVELNEGGKSKKTVLEHYFLCTIWPDKRIEMHLLDIYDEISDISEVVDLAEFKNRFFLQPGYMNEKPSREERLKQNLIGRLCDLADTHYKAREYHSAEYEFNRAIRLDENSVRANFGLGLTYIAQGDEGQARALFTKLANLDAVYEQSHKHLFNSFGIQLRKLGMFHQAMEHYNRALQIVQDDEHLWFNLGRCLHEDGKEPAARKMIIKALQLNPDFLEAQYFLQVYLKTPIRRRSKNV